MKITDRRAQRPTARHLQPTVWIVLADPLPGVLQPLIALRFWQMGEPGNFVVSPAPVAAHVLTFTSTRFEVVELDEEWQVIARPAAGCNASLAATKQAVEVSRLENAGQRLIRNFLDPQRK